MNRLARGGRNAGARPFVASRCDSPDALAPPKAGCTSIERLDSPLAGSLATAVTFGSLHPVTLLASKPRRD